MSKRRFYCDEAYPVFFIAEGLSRGNYEAEFTDEEWSRIEAAHRAYSEAQDLIAERVGFDR